MNYAITTNAKEKKNKKKKLFAIILLSSAVLMIVGVVSAFYSDIFQQSKSVTSATLKFNGTYTFYLNNVEAQLSDINNLNPGDVIVVKGRIENEGSQSAWVREKISLGSADNEFLQYFSVYNAELTQADLASGNDFTQYLLPSTSAGIFVGGNSVINGVGQDAQTESEGDYNYIGETFYEFVITIYFMNTAPNETQGKNATLSVATQGLQFANNNTSEPDESAWSVVAAA